MGIIAVLILSGPAVCSAGPRIACREAEHQFGRASNDTVVTNLFIIRNDGDAPLVIGRLRACCKGRMSMTQKVIEPGKNAPCTITLSLARRHGRQRKTFYIGSNDPNQPYLPLRMVGEAVSPVYLSPSTINFDVVGPQEVVERSLEAVCQPEVKLTVTNAVSTDAAFSVSLVSTNAKVVCVRTVPPLVPGAVSSQIHLLTDSPKYPKLTATVQAIVAGDLVAVPQVLMLRAGTTPKPTSRYIAIRSRTKKPFRIREATPPKGYDMKVTWGEMAGGGQRLLIKDLLPFSDLDGECITVTLDHEDTKELVIPISVK